MTLLGLDGLVVSDASSSVSGLPVVQVATSPRVLPRCPGRQAVATSVEGVDQNLAAGCGLRWPPGAAVLAQAALAMPEPGVWQGFVH